MLLTLLLVGALAYGGMAAALYLGQERILFQPTRTLVATPRHAGLSYEDVRFDTADGVTLHGWFVPAPRARWTLLFFHGNAGNVSHRLETLALLHELGESVLLFDYRGYGQSEGAPSEAGLVRDAEAAWRYLTQTRGIDAGRIVLMGRSLGGAVAAQLARRRPAAGLVLESTFTSVPELAGDLYPWLPARALARVRLDTLYAVRRLELPLLVVHSETDEIVPVAHGRRLYEAASAPKQWLAIDGGHNDGFLRSRGRYRAGLDGFLESLPLEAPGEAPADGGAEPLPAPQPATGSP
jgi:hypothetical protein